MCLLFMTGMLHLMLIFMAVLSILVLALHCILMISSWFTLLPGLPSYLLDDFHCSILLIFFLNKADLEGCLCSSFIYSLAEEVAVNTPDTSLHTTHMYY